MNPRISMITLGVRDLEVSVMFYQEGLGFPRMKSPPEVAFFTLNGTWLGLYGRDALAADAAVPQEGSGFESFALAHNVHSEAEVDEIISQAVAAGAALVKKTAEGVLGRVQRLLQRPGWPSMGNSPQPAFLGWTT